MQSTLIKKSTKFIFTSFFFIQQRNFVQPFKVKCLRTSVEWKLTRGQPEVFLGSSFFLMTLQKLGRIKNVCLVLLVLFQ